MNAIWIVLPILTLLMFELGLTLQTETLNCSANAPAPLLPGWQSEIILLPMLAFC